MQDGTVYFFIDYMSRVWRLFIQILFLPTMATALRSLGRRLTALPPLPHAHPFFLRPFSSFSDAQAAVKTLPSEPSNDEKLQLYALFKQATVGPNSTPKPSMLDFIGGAKWSAWKGLASLPAADAEAQYVALVRKLAGGAPTAPSPTSAPAPPSLPPLPLPPGAGPVYRAPLDAARGIGAIVLNAPPVNALGSAVLGELSASLRSAVADPSVTSLVLASASAPGVFSGGLDIAEMAGADEAGFARFWREVQGLFLALYTLEKPIVAAVEGASPAGGCWLAMQCDHRVLLDEPRATIGLNEVRLCVGGLGRVFASSTAPLLLPPTHARSSHPPPTPLFFCRWRLALWRRHGSLGPWSAPWGPACASPCCS